MRARREDSRGSRRECIKEVHQNDKKPKIRSLGVEDTQLPLKPFKGIIIIVIILKLNGYNI